MQNVRLFLFATLAMLLLLAWTQWQEDYGPATGEQATSESVGDRAVDTPAPATGETGGTAPATRTPGQGDQRTGKADADGGASGESTSAGTVQVTTDLLELTIDRRGGVLTSAHLLKHSVSSDNPAPFQLLQTEAPMFVAELGLVGDAVDAPDHRTRWQAEQGEYVLGEDAGELVVPLVWTGPDGLRVERRYIFERNSYVVRVEHHILNQGDAPRRLYQYNQLRREEAGSGQAFFGARSFVGGVLYTPEEKYQKYGFDDMRESPISRNVSDGWLAMIQHYFLGAWIPPRDVTVRMYSRVDRGQYVLGMSSPWTTVEPGGSATLGARLFVGPKEQDRLDAVVDGLELTVDYGWLTVISKPLFIALDWIHGIVGNWGWAIVILTLLIKIAFYKLSETSYRSMARMRKLQPRMQQLKERFGDDKQRMNQEVMQLYKEEKVNPLGGCLPIVIQIPVFIALYWVLLESVELRQAPWILWIDDLATRDPWYVLPLIMGGTMFLQQKLNPAPLDPIQQKVMMALPLVFTVFFMFFPAGLVLYWVTNNSLSILQQWVITRRIEGAQGGKAATPAKTEAVDDSGNGAPAADPEPAEKPAANPGRSDGAKSAATGRKKGAQKTDRKGKGKARSGKQR